MSRADPSPEPGRRTAEGRLALLTGGVAALLASSCCLGPLVLLLLGFSGAWIGNLSRLEPLRPGFIAVALVALGWAGRSIWRPVAERVPGRVCALPGVRRGHRWAFAIVALLRVDGVAGADVNFADRLATVRYDDAKVKVDPLERATRDAGYPSTVVADRNRPTRSSTLR